MPKTKRKSLLRRILWLACRAYLVGTVLAGCGIGVYTSVWLCKSAATEGTIVNLSPVFDEENDTTNFAPYFSFKAADGHTYTVQSNVATNPPGFEVGESVRVLYLRTDPTSAKLGSFWQIWLVTVLCVGLGAFFAGVGYLLLRYERKLIRRENDPHR